MEDGKVIHAPIISEEILDLRAGDMVYLSGTVITARDAAHKKMVTIIKENKSLPVDLKNQVIYYTGPCPAKPGHVIGSCGPTTSSRVDPYTPLLLDLGLKAMIGKGQRSKEVIQAIKRNKAIYFVAIGGAGALIAKCVKKAEVIAFEDLGPEAIYRLEIENLPLIVAIDTEGNNLYQIGPQHFKNK